MKNGNKNVEKQKLYFDICSKQENNNNNNNKERNNMLIKTKREIPETISEADGACFP